MKHKKFLGAASVALMIVIAVFLLATNALAAETYKTLHVFTGGTDGSQPGSVTLDQAGNLYSTTWTGGNLATAAVTAVVWSSSWRQTRTEAGPKACSTASRAAPMGELPSAVSSLTKQEIFTAQPTAAVISVSARVPDVVWSSS